MTALHPAEPTRPMPAMAGQPGPPLDSGYTDHGYIPEEHPDGEYIHDELPRRPVRKRMGAASLLLWGAHREAQRQVDRHCVGRDGGSAARRGRRRGRSSRWRRRRRSGRWDRARWRYRWGWWSCRPCRGSGGDWSRDGHRQRGRLGRCHLRPDQADRRRQHLRDRSDGQHRQGCHHATVTDHADDDRDCQRRQARRHGGGYWPDRSRWYGRRHGGQGPGRRCCRPRRRRVRSRRWRPWHWRKRLTEVGLQRRDGYVSCSSRQDGGRLQAWTRLGFRECGTRR